MSIVRFYWTCPQRTEVVSHEKKKLYENCLWQMVLLGDRSAVTDSGILAAEDQIVHILWDHGLSSFSFVYKDMIPDSPQKFNKVREKSM